MAGSLSGDVLPPQVIYQEKTDQCQSKYEFPADWHITHTPNHWANTETSYQYVDNIIVPYVMGIIEKNWTSLLEKKDLSWISLVHSSGKTLDNIYY